MKKNILPKVSVIIPTYNRAELLKNSILSVLSQTFQDFEVLIIDDSSFDKTEEVVKNMSGNQIKYIKNSTNKGVSAARNVGINNSRGDYIAFLDDDDEWLPEKLERQVILMDRISSDFGAVYTGAFSTDLARNNVLEIAIPKFRGHVLNEIILSNFIFTSSMIVRKRCFALVGLFDENLSYGEDFDMWIRISKEFLFESIPEALVKHKNHAHTTSSNKQLVAKNLENIIRKHAQLFGLNKKGLGNYMLKIGTAYCYDNKIKEGRKTFLKAIRSCPFDARLFYNFFLTFLGPQTFREMKKIKANIVQRILYYKTRTLG